MMRKILIALIIPLILSIGLIHTISFADSLKSPRQQMNDGTIAEHVICKSSFTLMIKMNGDAACVTSSTASKLSIAGWGQIIKGWIDTIDVNNEDLKENMRRIEPNGVVVIGQDQDKIGGGFDPSQGFDGLLDDIRVFDRIISEQELEFIMNGSETNLSPIIHLTFDDGKSATDISGFQNHAKIVGDVRFEKIDIPDFLGNKYAIDTNNKDYLIIENLNAFPTDKFSLSFWIKTQDSANGIFSYSIGEYPIDNELLIIDPSKLRFYRGEYRIDPELSINDNQWKHLLITWTSTDGMTKIFLNGEKAFSSNKMWCHIPERLGGC